MPSYLNVLPWLLHGSNKYEFQKYVDNYDHEVSGWASGDLTLFLSALTIIIVARLAFNAAFLPLANRLAEKYGKDDSHKDGRKLLEEVWVLIGNIMVLVAAMYVMMYHNGGCSWLSRSLYPTIEKCLKDWPNHTVQPAAALYLHIETAWYVALLLKPIFRYGLKDGVDMATHHMTSLFLLLSCFAFNLTRFGFVVLTIFAISNPILHAAKIANQLNAPSPIRLSGFALFALLFFVSRVVMVPFVILYPAMYLSRYWVPYAVEDLKIYYIFLNLLLLSLYVMQLIWMKSIIRVLRKASHSGIDAASNLSRKLDPSKRYTCSSEDGHDKTN